jgi:hypothetical protein
VKRLIWLLALIAILYQCGPSSSSAVRAPTVSQSGALIINEYLADPPDGASGDSNRDGTRDATQDEFVEIVNTTNSTLDISGFTLSDSSAVRFTFPPGTRVPPGEAVVVFGGGSPAGPFGNALVFAASGSAGLSLTNSGDSIIIKNGTQIIDSLTYGSSEGSADQSITRSPDITGGFVKHSQAAGSIGLFSPGTRVDGRPFVSSDPIINSISPDSTVAGAGPILISISGARFQSGARVRVGFELLEATFISPTELMVAVPASIANLPGAHQFIVENPNGSRSNAVTFTVLAQIGINEILADPPDGNAGDANGDGRRDATEDEFVEVVNRTGSPLDVGGFQLRDASKLLFAFPPGTIIPAGEAAVIFGGGSPQGEFGNAAANELIFVARLSLSNSGETLLIRDPLGNEVERVTYGGEGGQNQSLNRSPEVVGLRFVLHSALAGGVAFSPGARADGSPFTPAPRITDIDPDQVLLGGQAFNLSVRGSGFEQGSVVLLDSTPLSTNFLSAGELSARVPSELLGIAGDRQVRVRNPGGNRSNSLPLRVIRPAPALSSLRPSSIEQGSSDFLLSLLGSGFDSTSVALVDGSAVATTFINRNELRALVPASFAATVGIRLIRIRNGDGQESNPLALEVIPPRPRIISIFPTSASAGGPDFLLAIRGANFRVGAVALFGGSQLETSFFSASELAAMVPSELIREVGTRAVVVRNGDGSESNEVSFSVIPELPIISAIEPDSIAEGSHQTNITILGERFKRGASVRVVESGVRLGARLRTSFFSGQKLEAELTSDLLQKAGRLFLAVENPDGGISNNAALNILVRDRVVINEYLADPPDGPAGDANGDGVRSPSEDEFIEILNRAAEPVDISGYRLLDSRQVRHIFPPGTILPPLEAAVVFGGGNPKGQFGNAAANKLVFVASSGSLSLDNGGDAIRLEDVSGRVLQEIIYGSAEGNAAQSLNRDPDGGGATFSPHSTLNPLKLFSPGARVNGETFSLRPSITSLAPSSVRAGSGNFTLVVSGKNFLPGAAVIFDQSQLRTVFRSDLQLEAEVEAELIREGGAAQVRVRNPRGELSEVARFLIIGDPPRIASMRPQKVGTGAEDVEITVGGERFQRGATLQVAGEAIQARFVSQAELRATLSNRFFARAAELEVRVRNADGNLSNAAALLVENGPLITRLSRSKVKAGRGPVEISIAGVAFQQGAALFVNERRVATVFVSEVELGAVIPADMTERPTSLTLQVRNPDGGRSNKAALKVVAK